MNTGVSENGDKPVFMDFRARPNGPSRNDNLALEIEILSELDALLRDPAEFLRHPPEIDDIDRKKSWRFLELVVDCRQSRMRHGSGSLDADVDIRAFGRRPRRAGAEQKYAISGIGQMPPDHQSGEFGGVGGILDRSHMASTFPIGLNRAV
jgi:hypothetical protein